MKLAIPSANNTMRAIFLFICFLGTCSLFGQGYDRLDVQLRGEDKSYKNPWVGGLVAPQFNSIDIDLDGLNDILVFDRLGNVILPYINDWQGGVPNYRFAPEYVDVFPLMRNWVRIRDFNADGVPDIFTYPVGTGIPGIAVYRGKIANGALTFEKVTSSLGRLDILYFEIGGSVTQVYVSVIDMPEIKDLDGDGDLDIIAFDPSGGQVSYYKNLAVEQNLSLDSLVYELADVCYGKFIESGFSEDVILSPDGVKCGSSLLQEVVEVRHAGSTITAFDENGDGLQDIFLGDLTYDGIVRLTNGGTPEEAWFSESEPGFPSYDEAIDIDIYNTIFHLDYDNDGRKDLLVAPNEDNPLQTDNHVWYYKNRGTEEEPDFDLDKKNAFIDQMLDLGLEARPVFIDLDQEGWLDMVVGTSGHREGNKQESRLVRFQNSGRNGDPAFEIVDDDFLNFSRFSEDSNNFAPCFGDLDGDGDQDMLVGDDKGALYYVENIASGNRKLFEGATPIYNYQNIQVGTHVKPFLVDINQDGLLDLVIGERNFNSIDGEIGSLNYIENTGTVAEPEFGEVTSEIFGNVSTKDPRFINNYSSPYFFKNGEELLLFNGSENGNIYLYENITSEEPFTLVDDKLGNIREGIRTQPAVADIDNDGLLDIVVGNRRGGLSFYTTDIKDMTVSNEELEVDNLVISVTPNPVVDQLTVSLNQTGDYRLKLIDVHGKILLQNKFKNETVLTFSNYPAGVYFLEIVEGLKSTVRKIVKQ